MLYTRSNLSAQSAVNDSNTFFIRSQEAAKHEQKPDANGKVGTVLSYDSASSRFAVRVGSESFKIRGENLTNSIFPPPAGSHG